MNSRDADAQLMSHYCNGDLHAFDMLYERHKAPLYRSLLRHLRNAAAAADVFPEVWSRRIATRAPEHAVR